MTSCGSVTLLVQMRHWPWTYTQSISEMHDGVRGMRLLSQQSPHTFPEQMYVCTCLPSQFVPITSSKDLELCSRLPVCCAAHVLVQLAESARVAEGCWLLLWVWPDGLRVQRQDVSLRTHRHCHMGMGFTMIRSWTLMVTHHSYQQTLSSFNFAHFFHRWAPFLCILAWFLQTGVIQDEHMQPMSTNPRMLLAWQVAWW